MSGQPVHASCVALDGRAVLLLGVSGSGKSDLALRLIDRGWAFVADDYVHVKNSGGRLAASPPPKIAGRMEIRNVGLVDIPHLQSATVALAIWLDGTPERMPQIGHWHYDGVDVPAFAINAFEPSAPLKIEHLLRLNGLSLK
jgi:hypothetical protein